MAVLGNILWFILGGWINGLVYLVLGGICCLTIIGIPIGKACFQFAYLSALPFGKVLVSETWMKGKENVAAIRQAGGNIANVLWLPVGVLLMFLNVFELLFLCITIIGIPVAVALAKMLKFLLWPIGTKVITKDQFREIMIRKAVEEGAVTGPVARPGTSQGGRIGDCLTDPDQLDAVEVDGFSFTSIISALQEGYNEVLKAIKQASASLKDAVEDTPPPLPEFIPRPQKLPDFGQPEKPVTKTRAICPKCQQDLQDGWKFCKHCGQKVSA